VQLNRVGSTYKNSWRFKLFLTALLIGILISISPVQSSPQEDGEALFKQKCVSCHTIGGGALIGPDLLGVTKNRDQDWLARFIEEPDKMIAEGDPIVSQLLKEYNNLPMPNLGLTKEEVNSILAYLVSRDGGKVPTQTTPPEPQQFIQGDPKIGRTLFTGAVNFEKGGPACMTCHNIASLVPLEGGALGPDLSAAYNKFGEAGISSILNSLSFPTMIPIYGNSPLTSEEQAHLGAFLKASNSMESPLAISILVLYLTGMFGVVAILVVADFVWRSRLKGVRRPLLRKKNSKKGGE
jgi:mono/diheme cytochrome c family protein